MSEQAVVQAPPTPEQRAAREEAGKKMLTSLIDAAAVGNPELKTRVTLAAVWQYMQLPDSSFGWVPKAKGEEVAPPLPQACKALCVITSLKYGLDPGLGNVLWLGNKCFLDVYGKRTLAARAGLIVLGRPIRKLTADEIEIFGINQGDRTLAIDWQYKRGDMTLNAVSYGIIDRDELKPNQWGKMKAGMGSVKDVAMTLITRAERDFYNRYFPVDGIADMPEDPRAYAEQLEPQSIGPSVDATTIAAVNAGTDQVAAQVAADEEDAEENLALKRFGDATRKVIAANGDVNEILGIRVDPWLVDAKADDLNAGAEILEEWLKANSPDPQPPKGKVGRPPTTAKGKAKAEAAITLDLAGTVTPPAAPAPVAVRLEVELEPGEPDPTPLEVGARDEMLGTGPARERAVDRVKSAMDRVLSEGGLPMRILGYNPHNRINDPTAGGHELSAMAELLEQWKPGAQGVVDKHEAAKSAPPPGRFDDAPPPEQPFALGGPAPGGRREATAAAKAPPAAPPHNSPPTTMAPKPTTTTAPPAAKDHGLEMVTKALTSSDMPDAVKARLMDLQTRRMRQGDHLHLPKAIRLGRTGDLRELDELLGRAQPR